jgi:hypothetical protein
VESECLPLGWRNSPMTGCERRPLGDLGDRRLVERTLGVEY